MRRTIKKLANKSDLITVRDVYTCQLAAVHCCSRILE